MKGFIYKIVNTKTTDIYVGSTIQNIKNRFKTHKSNARVGKSEKLYDFMRNHGIDCFSIELIEEFELSSKSELGIKEQEYYNTLKPTLNMRLPTVSTDKKYGKIYRLSFSKDITKFYIGSTTKQINIRLAEHRHSSKTGTTPIYVFMREQGKENFTIDCLEDNIPIDQLIIRENHWISELKPTLNKNVNLCITDKERDRLKYIKNREKRLKQVNERRLLKRDEINEQKREHYKQNKDRISQKDKEKRHELRTKEIILYTEHPHFTEESLSSHTIFELKEIAKKLKLNHSPKLKDLIVQKILDQQKRLFENLQSS